jgi:hypothetical protein
VERIRKQAATDVDVYNLVKHKVDLPRYNKVVKQKLADFIDTFEKIFYLGGYINITRQNFPVKRLLFVIAKQNNLDPCNADPINDGRIKELITYIDSE